MVLSFLIYLQICGFMSFMIPLQICGFMSFFIPLQIFIKLNLLFVEDIILQTLYVDKQLLRRINQANRQLLCRPNFDKIVGKVFICLFCVVLFVCLFLTTFSVFFLSFFLLYLLLF